MVNEEGQEEPPTRCNVSAGSDTCQTPRSCPNGHVLGVFTLRHIMERRGLAADALAGSDTCQTPRTCPNGQVLGVYVMTCCQWWMEGRDSHHDMSGQAFVFGEWWGAKIATDAF